MNLDPASQSILHSIFALGLLTLVMSVLQGMTRLPAMKKAGVSLQKAAHAADLNALLPSNVRRVNDNYNHLLEAPTVFYAIALALIVGGLATPFYAECAWVYVILRVLHSAVQATFNRVSIRAPLYILSWIAMAPMIVAPLLP